VLVTVGEEGVLSVEDILVKTAGKVEHCGATLGITSRASTRKMTEHTQHILTLGDYQGDIH